MPMITLQTAQDLMHPGEDLEQIMRGIMAGPSTAAIKEDVGEAHPTGREKMRQELSKAWLRIWQLQRMQELKRSQAYLELSLK